MFQLYSLHQVQSAASQSQAQMFGIEGPRVTNHQSAQNKRVTSDLFTCNCTHNGP